MVKNLYAKINKRGLYKKFVTQQRNSTSFVNFMEKLFPNMPMSKATEILAKDLYDAAIFNKDIGKKYKKMLKHEKK